MPLGSDECIAATAMKEAFQLELQPLLSELRFTVQNGLCLFKLLLSDHRSVFADSRFSSPLEEARVKIVLEDVIEARKGEMLSIPIDRRVFLHVFIQLHESATISQELAPESFNDREELLVRQNPLLAFDAGDFISVANRGFRRHPALLYLAIHTTQDVLLKITAVLCRHAEFDTQ